MNKMKFKDKEFNALKLLGKGKGGYSYLVEDGNNNLFVLKKIHHEPCSYYSFPEDKLSLPSPVSLLDPHPTNAVVSIVPLNKTESNFERLTI